MNWKENRLILRWYCAIYEGNDVMYANDVVGYKRTRGLSVPLTIRSWYLEAHKEAKLLIVSEVFGSAECQHG